MAGHVDDVARADAELAAAACRFERDRLTANRAELTALRESAGLGLDWIARRLAEVERELAGIDGALSTNGDDHE